ncbi:heme ABC exporter ATP-binding protein CcmA [Rickettsia endosymbiont of Cardiosporidium cionae]|uniref:heme ABC exporter ATP-binding protein CcmA n=1 Tax=Rickettsia endosymbiont of Cardiosporidium cionae TaxID=2777155 RepID=UPI00389AEEE0|nr:heme ABC exporter ATP-binding protein CcmA [Rickettsia endosymbiont of Cardiosporidium cionae]
MLSLNFISLHVSNRKLFDKIAITFLPSSIVVIKGENGAGKTSLLRIIAGIQSPSQGNVIYKHRYISHKNSPYPYCNYIAHNLAVKFELTVFENIKFWSNLYNTEQLIKPAVKYFALEKILHNSCSSLSYGNLKKLVLTRLILIETDLWLLDEIDSNLDDINFRLLYDLIITKAQSNAIILIVTHSNKFNELLKQSLIKDIRIYTLYLQHNSWNII